LLQFEGHLGLSDIFRFIEEKLGVAIWHCDAAGQMQWSHGVYELLGLDPRKIAPSYEEMDRRIHPDDRRPRRDFRELMFDRTLLDGDFRIIRSNGTLRWVRNQAEVLLNAAGETTGVLGVTLDITEQRKTLDSLRVDAERYDALTRIAGGLLWIGSSDGRITALPNAEAVPQAVLFFGRGWMDLLREEDREAAQKAWAECAETGRPYRVEHQLRWPDGAYRWFRCLAVPVTNPDRSIREWVGISIDVQQEKLSIPAETSLRLTGAQMRGARGMLNWSVKQLAQQTGISSAIIRRFEESNDSPQMPDETMDILRKTLSDAGIDFLFPQVGKPGVRLR
jgi:PAS domain S-box-containing protein